MKYLKGHYVILLLVVLHFTHIGFGQVSINEFMASNETVLLDTVYDNHFDWIELYNAGNDTVDIAAYYLTDDLDDITKWSFPINTKIYPDSFLIVFASGLNLGLHTSYKLKSSGEQIGLYDAAQQLVDSLTFSQQLLDVSYGIDSQGDWLFYDEPTPGLENTTAGYAGFLLEPTFSVKGGMLDAAVQLNLSTQEGFVFYTTDGSEPNLRSIPYVMPIVLDTTTVIRARAFATAYRPSEIATETYILHDQFTLPVFSITTDPRNLYNDTVGIYVTGLFGTSNDCFALPRNWNQNWERAANLEMFETGGMQVLNQRAGLKIAGACSRDYEQKSLSLTARDIYGDDDFDYSFFKEKDINSFKSFKLRNSGGDWLASQMLDAVSHSIVAGQMDVDYAAYQPAIAFLNGQYWGMLNVREKTNEDYITSNFSIDKDSFDLLENDREIIHGSDQAYNQFMDDILALTSHDEANYAEVKEWMDVPEYINYMTIQMYLANTDWPGNNVRYWKSYDASGKWRWILNDTDFGWGGSFNNLEGVGHNTFAFATLPNGTAWPNPAWSTLLFREMLEFQAFRYEFAKSFTNHMNTTFDADRVLHVIDSLQTIIEPEIPRHFIRWDTVDTYWQVKVHELETFAELRPDSILKYMHTALNLGNMLRIDISRSNRYGAGLWVNDLWIEEDIYSGSWFQAVPIDLRVEPNYGFSFEKWIITKYDALDSMLIEKGSNWKYLDDGTDQGSAWNKINYNDAVWEEGLARLGYGDEDDSTILNFGADADDKHITYYFRKEFNLTDKDLFEQLSIGLRRDDGAVVYVNGVEVLRSNMSEGEINYQTLAAVQFGGIDESKFYEYTVSADMLVNGKNVIAVEMHQGSSSSSDMGLDLWMKGTIEEVQEVLEESNMDFSFTPLNSVHIEAVFTEQATPDLTGLYINEFMASNLSAFADDFGSYDDWIEIYNASKQAIDIGGLFITDDLRYPQKYQLLDNLPEQTTVEAGGFLLLWADGNVNEGALHLNFGLSKVAGDIGISQNGYYFLDSISYTMQLEDSSYARTFDAYDEWEINNEPTPGESNGIYVEQFPDLNAVKIYPNPTLTSLSIEYKDAGSYTLFDSMGRIMFEGELIAGINTLDITKLYGGVYFMKIRVGAEEVTKRVVKW